MRGPLWGLVLLALVLAPTVAAQSEEAGPDEQQAPVNASAPLGGGPTLPEPNPPGLGDLAGTIALPAFGLLVLGAALAIPVERAVVLVTQRVATSDPEAVLKHETRSRIHEYLKVNPGAHYRALQRALDLPNATLRWHLDKLEASGLVASRRLPGRRVYYCNGGHTPPDEAILHALLENANLVRILEALREKPGLTASAVARKLELNPMTVRWHVGKLLREGIVEQRPNGRGAALEIVEDRLAGVRQAMASQARKNVPPKEPIAPL